MAEIYTSSMSASQGPMSPDASDHINSVLSDLGLGGTSGDSSVASHSVVEPEATAGGDASHVAGSTGDAAHTDLQPSADTVLVSPTAVAEPVSHVAPEPAPAPATAIPETQTAAYAAPAPVPGADSLPGSHATYGADTFHLGTDTLWGSDGGTGHTLAAAPPEAGSDTIRSSGGMETIYGGNATIYASGHTATLNTDMVHAGGDGSTMDGSASTQALHTDGSGSFDHLPGGSGSDTIVLHDTVGGSAPAASDDGHAATAYAGHDAYGTDTHDPTFLAGGSPDSVMGGDGSDHFAAYGYDASWYGDHAGSAGDGSAGHDPYAADGHVTHSDAGTFVSYHDGYDASYSGSDHLVFQDTVLAG